MKISEKFSRLKSLHLCNSNVSVLLDPERGLPCRVMPCLSGVHGMASGRFVDLRHRTFIYRFESWTGSPRCHHSAASSSPTTGWKVGSKTCSRSRL
jgi:hypothetical protein